MRVARIFNTYGPKMHMYDGKSTINCYRYTYMAANFFLGKVTALGVLCCFSLFVCLTLLASFFLPSHLSFTCTCHYPGLLLHTELIVSLFIRCTMGCTVGVKKVSVSVRSVAICFKLERILCSVSFPFQTSRNGRSIPIFTALQASSRCRPISCGFSSFV